MADSSRKTTGELMLEVKTQLIESLKVLNSIWDDIGLLEEQKQDRRSLAFMYIRNLIEEMVTEEEKRRKTLTDNINIYKETLSQLCAELNIAPIHPTATRLFEVEKELKQSVNCWQNEKNSRMSALEELTATEQVLCDIMHTTPLYIPSGCVPSKDQLTTLRQHIDQLATEKIKRFDKFLEQRDSITKILSDIGQEVTTEFEQDVVIEDPECFTLSESNMAQLSALAEQLQGKLTNLVKEMDNLRDDLEALWNRLETSQEERQDVMKNISDHTPASFNFLKEELAKCEILKFEHLQEFTLKVREELQEWWEKCHYSKKQRESFSPFHSEIYTEELLSLHEAALVAVKQFYRENEHLLRKIVKRTELWNQMVEFDAKESDPNRYKNRGGNLLVEERDKKKVLRKLPKVEEQLKNEIEEWESDNGRQFLIGGVQFFEFCRLQWEEYKLTKELEKQQRLEQKEKEMQSEIRFGCKPTPTPSKRRFGAAGLNPQTPKQRKLNDTTRSTTRLHTLSKIHSVFTSPSTPSSTSMRTPMRQAKTTSNLHSMTPLSTRRPPVPRTPMSTMAPPRTPMSTRSTARKMKDIPKAKSCVSLASPMLTTGKTSNLMRAKSEKKQNQENTTPPSSSIEDIVSSQSSQSSVEVGSAVQSYEEFEKALHSCKKTKQYRSTICPPK